MGHGDEIVIADANFTATAWAAPAQCQAIERFAFYDRVQRALRHRADR
jgi:L-fucose mutarotase/ribose pyranase (RbsD/FucU family)